MVFSVEDVRINGRSRKETESECVLSTSMLNLVLVIEALRPVAEMTRCGRTRGRTALCRGRRVVTIVVVCM